MGIVVNRTRLNPFPIKSASGEFISIDDAVNRPVKKLEISFAPQQDLHGYDYPWAEGCGKNLADVYIAPDRIDVPYRGLTLTYVTDADGNKLGVSYVGTLTQTGGIAPSYAFIPSSDGEYILGVKILSGTTTGINYFFVWDGTASKDMKVHWTDPNQYATLTLTGGHRYVVSPNFGPVNSNINVQLSAYIIPSNSTTIEWSPYANICPISGYEGLTFSQSDLVLNASDISFSTGNIGDNGENTSGSGYKRSEYIDVKNISSMTFNLESTYSGGWVFRICGYNDNEEFTKLLRKTTISYKGSYSYTHDVSDISFIRFAITRTNITPTLYGDLTTIPVSWQTEAGEVYGGTLDLVHGVVTANIVSVTTNNDNVFRSSAKQNNTNGTLFDVHVNLSPKHSLPIFEISNIFMAGIHSYLQVENNQFYCVYQGGSNVDCMRICWGKPKGASTLEEFKTFLQSNQAQFVYELETPLTYQLTPHQISTLMGSNRIWTDVGTISLDYRAMRSAQNTPLLGMLGSPNVPEEPIEEVEE